MPVVLCAIMGMSRSGQESNMPPVLALFSGDRSPGVYGGSNRGGVDSLPATLR